MGARCPADSDQGALEPRRHRKRVETNPEEQRWERSGEVRAKDRQEAKAGWDERREGRIPRTPVEGQWGGRAGEGAGRKWIWTCCVLNVIHAGCGAERLKYTCYSF